MDINWTEVLIAALSTGGAAGVIKAWRSGNIKVDKFDLSTQDPFDDDFEDDDNSQMSLLLKEISIIYHLLNVLTESTSAGRAIILKNHNGDDPAGPHAGSLLYITALYEVFRELGPMSEKFQRAPVDEAYSHLLQSIATKTYVQLCTDSLHDGFLRTFYRSNGVSMAHKFKIYTHDKAMYYLSVMFAEDHELTDDERETVRYCVTELRNLFKDSYG